MSQRSVKGVHASSPGPDDQRNAPRLEASEVPWVESLKLTLDDTSKLINISKTGALVDTRARILPSRRTTVTINTAENPGQRVQAVVVRSHLVAVVPGTGPLYRTALKFEGEVAWSPPVQAPSPPALAERESSLESIAAATSLGTELELHEGPHLDGPLEGLFSTEAGSHVVSVSQLTESGCTIRTTCPVEIGDWVSVSVFFSDVRRLLLTGSVMSLEGGTACQLRFANLAVEDRRALRVELRGHSVRPGQGVAALSAHELSETKSRAMHGGAVAERSGRAPSLRSNRW